MSIEVLFLLEILLIIIGIVGCFAPGLPGIPFVFGSILLQHFFDPIRNYPTWLLIVLSFFVIAVMIVQYFLPAMSTKTFGASKYAMRGAIIGLLLGLILPGVGFLLGPLLGAMLGELLLAKKNVEDSFKAGLGALIGILASSIFELFGSLVIIGVFVYYSV